jgi:PhnB protein
VRKPGRVVYVVAPDELAARFADPAALEAMAYVQRTLRDELAASDRQ